MLILFDKKLLRVSQYLDEVLPDILAKLEEKLPFYLPGANLVLYGQKT